LLPNCHCQDVTLPSDFQNEADLSTTIATTAATPSGVNRFDQEGFFINGSSYAVISETLHLERGSHIGFSFRTCSTGKVPIFVHY